MIREEICMAGYGIVQHTGSARNSLVEAVESASAGNYEKAQRLIERASELICKAQSIQTLFQEQEETETIQKLHFIVEHGNDHLMTTMIFRDLVAEVTETGAVHPQELKAIFKAYH